MKKVIKVLFVCHGNICRSTMAQSYFSWLVSQEKLSQMFEIDSAATSREEIGNGPHRGTVKVLKKNHIPVVPHRARQMTKADARHFDLLIGMDQENVWYMNYFSGKEYADKIHLLLEFSPDGSLRQAREVDDPWYSGDFEAAYKDVKAGCEGLLAYCKKNIL